MRVLIFHGYLLRGTGSNVYTASLAAALRDAGHEVTLLCQERAPLELAAVDAAGDWDAGALRIERRREPVRCTVLRPDIGDLLPVYVPDRYEALRAIPFGELDDAQVERYVAANVAAVRETVALMRPDLALANHLVMGPAILARALAGSGIPFAVKIHGSALEYVVRPHPRFLPWAREGLAEAAGILVGSRHTAERLWGTLDDPSIRERTRLGPPGVDVARFHPRSTAEAAQQLATVAAAARREPAPASPAPHAQPAGTLATSVFARDDAALAAALGSLDFAADRHVAFVGKLIPAKGVDLLLAAWPLVLAQVPRARLVVVGFGDARDAYVHAARHLGERVVFTGRLEHDELAPLLGGCAALVVPSTFPEAFGMVAAEAAACGTLPICAGHSGLAEVTGALAEALPPVARPWLSFPVDDDAVSAIAARTIAWLQAPPELRAQVRAALAATARDRWSWASTAQAVIAAAQGRLERLPLP